MIGHRERNKLYLEPRDALHREGCPVCTCVDAATIGQLKAALDRASGQQVPSLCIAHTARMAADDDGYGCTAVLGFIRDAGDWLRAQIDRARHRYDARALVDRLRRAAARHYRCVKALEDNKTLQMHLAGAHALARSLEEQAARLKEELLSCRSQSGPWRESDSGR